MFRHGVAGCGRLGFAWRIGAIVVSVFAVSAANTSLWAQEAAKPALAAGTVQQNAGQRCGSQGPDGVIYSSSGWCVTAGGSLLGYASKELTDTDIALVGQRIPTPFNAGAGVPIAIYYLDNISAQTLNPGLGGTAEAHMLMRRETEDLSFRAFVRVNADTRARYDEYGDVHVGLRLVDQSYYLGALDEAWVQVNGLKLGIQQSLFGFNRLPSVITPGYTSIVTTPAISYTYGIDTNASISFSAEDSARRRFGDGVLARPADSHRPDGVALLRFRTPSTLYHLSGAIHQSEDEIMKELAGGSDRTVIGWATSAGLQSRVRWSDYLGDEAKGVYGRFGLTAAYASGALAYLGIPLFAPDYVVSGSGAINRSTGWSGIAFYEHMLATDLKASASLSYFRVGMHSTPEEVVPDFDPNLPGFPNLGFNVRVQGTVAQTSLEYIPVANWVLGLEGGYTWTEAKGTYSGVDASKVSVGYPHIGMYVRRVF
jgi:hypothetical protein